MSLFNGFDEDWKFVLFLLNIDKKVEIFLEDHLMLYAK